MAQVKLLKLLEHPKDLLTSLCSNVISIVKITNIGQSAAKQLYLYEVEGSETKQGALILLLEIIRRIIIEFDGYKLVTTFAEKGYYEVTSIG